MPHSYRSIFTQSTAEERVANFETYLAYVDALHGALLEAERDLTVKGERRLFFEAHPVRSRRPLADAERFYRNAYALREDPRTFDGPTLLLTFLYKFAWHEWIGISAAWDTLPVMNEPDRTIERINLY